MEPQGGRRRALILDRDGVINHDDGYVHRIADCRFIDGIFTMTGAFAARGFAIVIATNQSGIGRGLFSEEDFAALMRWMTNEFARHGVALAAVYHCPFHPTQGIGAYRKASDWRKPLPGMLLQAARDLDLDLAASWCIGDKSHDIEAGRAAGVGTLVQYVEGAPGLERKDDYWIAPSLAAVTALLVKDEASPQGG